MRYLNGVLCVIMILFVIVQYNDPDYALWIVIYGIPAIWAGLAALLPGALRYRLPAAGLVLCTVAAVVGTVYMWPTAPGWWGAAPASGAAPATPRDAILGSFVRGFIFAASSRGTANRTAWARRTRGCSSSAASS